MTVVKKYRAVIWKTSWTPHPDPWFVGFVATTGRVYVVERVDLRRRTHEEALQAACDTLRKLNTGATEDDGVVDP